jgi:hypothetical protein
MYPSLKVLEEKRLRTLFTLKKAALILCAIAVLLFLFLSQNAFFKPLHAALLALFIIKNAVLEDFINQLFAFFQLIFFP